MAFLTDEEVSRLMSTKTTDFMTAGEFEKIERSARRRNAVRKTVTYVFLAIWALIVLFPFYWMVLTSLKSYGAYNSEYTPKLYTLAPTLRNYIDAFTQVPLTRYFFNTLIFTAVTTALMLAVTVLAAPTSVIAPPTAAP